MPDLYQQLEFLHCLIYIHVVHHHLFKTFISGMFHYCTNNKLCSLADEDVENGKQNVNAPVDFHHHETSFDTPVLLTPVPEEKQLKKVIRLL